MTQHEQHEFRESLEEALSWMQAIQERLKQNDNTQGPRTALEARLGETEVRPHLTFVLRGHDSPEIHRSPLLRCHIF